MASTPGAVVAEVDQRLPEVFLCQQPCLVQPGCLGGAWLTGGPRWPIVDLMPELPTNGAGCPRWTLEEADTSTRAALDLTYRNPRRRPAGARGGDPTEHGLAETVPYGVSRRRAG
jgi:hypothetical protein